MSTRLQLTPPAHAASGHRGSAIAAPTVARASPRQLPPAAVMRCACGGSCPRCGGAGQALVAPLRASMEARLGSASLADVRVHTDTRAARAAAEAGAHAFTIGTDIFFDAGRFAPNTSEGATRLAHELVHVEQQRRGLRGQRPLDRRSAEREARELGASAAAGERVKVHGAAPLMLQREGPESDDRPAPALSAGLQLHLDPEIERLMTQHFIRWWLGSALLLGKAPTALPPVGDTASDAEPAAEPAAGLPGIAPGLVGVPIHLPALTPGFFAPLPPDPFFLQPDVGALFAPFGARGAPVGAGDIDVVMDIYRRNAAIASQLPDLRGMTPGFLKPLIPHTWRRDIAGALTGAAVDAALKHDFMSPIDVADRAWEGMTGASTTLIPFPSVSF